MWTKSITTTEAWKCMKGECLHANFCAGTFKKYTHHVLLIWTPPSIRKIVHSASCLYWSFSIRTTRNRRWACLQKSLLNEETTMVVFKNCNSGVLHEFYHYFSSFPLLSFLQWVCVHNSAIKMHILTYVVPEPNCPRSRLWVSILTKQNSMEANWSLNSLCT